MSRQVIYIILGIIALIIFIALVAGLISLLFRVITSPFSTPPTPTPIIIPTPTPLATLTPTPIPPPVGVVTPTPIPIGGGPGIITVKTVTGPGFAMDYPSSWGILTCANSPNFEFNPRTPVDQLGVVCTFAQEPITVLVSNNLSGCAGQNINIASVPVIFSTTTSANFISHQWCTLTQPILKISHRVSTSSFPATSPVDYSPQIEQMIASLRFTSTTTAQTPQPLTVPQTPATPLY